MVRIFALLLAVAAGAAAPAAAAPRTASCHLQGFETPVRCVELDVPLDYAEPDGASIAIRAVANGTATRVEVEDDGPGFDPDRESPGHGLALLRARLAMSFESQARLDVQSRPGRTRVAIVVPSRGVPVT